MRFDIIFNRKCEECNHRGNSVTVTAFPAKDEKDAKKKIKIVFGTEKITCTLQTITEGYSDEGLKKIKTVHGIEITSILETTPMV